MRKSYVTVYDLNMRRVAELENAANIAYETPMNSLWKASFDLPIDDSKNEYCKPFYFVEIYDGDERIDLFRILPSTGQKSAQIQRIRYQCEHVLATLIDDVLFQYHTIGNLGVYTRQVLQYILDRQTTKRWQLGTVEFDHQFEYNWENTNLLGALFSVPKPFVDEYMWTWDTTVYPWTVHLVRPSNVEQARIRYGRNMRGIRREEDPSNLVNRIYALGYGEGVNQLTFAEINGGVPYVEDQESIAKYGLKATVWVDRRFEHPETLKARAEALLKELKDPRVSYTVQASELYALTRDPIDKFRTGSLIRVQDPDFGDLLVRVVNVKKKNVLGSPGDVELEIANRPQDIAGTIADLQNRLRVEEVYAQGATNINSHDFADNCDPQHPAVMRFYIPEETARINKVTLSYQVEPFRAYSRAIAGGGGIATSTAAGGGSVESTSSGGGVQTSTASGGGVQTSTASGGGGVVTTPAGGGATSGPSSTQTTVPAGQATLETEETTGGSWNISGDYTIPDIMQPSGDHNHGIPHGTQLAVYGGGYVTFIRSGTHAHGLVPHSHKYATLNHVHGMDHTHTTPDHMHEVILPNHTHDVEIPNHTHDVEIPDHTHQVTIPEHTHEITLPDHTHEIEHGIFAGPTPTAVTVKVDGNTIPGLGINETDIDIIPYLSKDGGGKIRRGTWHTIEITPNTLGRIVANVVSQIFVQSRGGGNY